MRPGKDDCEKSSRRAYHHCLMCWWFDLYLSRFAYETHLRSMLSAEARVLDLAPYPTLSLSQRPVHKHFYELSC